MCFVALFLLAQKTSLQQNDRVENEKELKDDLEEDPLMAPIRNDLDEVGPSMQDTEAELSPLPQMADLFKDSESVSREESSKVRDAIYREEQAILDAGLSLQSIDQGKEGDDDDNDDNSAMEQTDQNADSIFNTDDFDDDFDDVDGDQPSGPFKGNRAVARAASSS